MPEVCLREFDHIERHFVNMDNPMVELAAIHTKGDKIVRSDKDGIGYIYEVYDIHYDENGAVDVNLIRITD